MHIDRQWLTICYKRIYIHGKVLLVELVLISYVLLYEILFVCCEKLVDLLYGFYYDVTTVAFLDGLENHLALV